MIYTVTEQGQMNVEISNLVVTEMELEAVQAGLVKIYRVVEAFQAKEDGQSKRGARYIVRFIVPGPMVFKDECADLLRNLGIVGWSIEAQASEKGNPGYF